MARATRTKVVGTTRILEPVGQGGMAEIYRGIQEPLGRHVAIKVMLPKLAVERNGPARFRREALALANLQHENIVGIHDFIEKNDQLFMIMEYVDGVDLATLIGAGSLPLDITLLVGARVASALEHAHFRRVLHRDIKPSNVMLSRRGQVKLTDFGIAKDTSIDDLTRTGAIVGTPAYLPPELFSRQKPDHRGDIYSLGVLLYECLAGERPFHAENQAELFAAIAMGRRARLRKLAPQTPRRVEKIIDQCLALQPEKRWPRAALMRERLERELGRVLKETPSARLVNFLQARGYLGAEDISDLDQEELLSSKQEPPEPPDPHAPTQGPSEIEKRAKRTKGTKKKPRPPRSPIAKRLNLTTWVLAVLLGLVGIIVGIVWLVES